MRALEETRTPDIRMADSARFIVAAEPVLPWPRGAFLDAYERSRRDANAALAEGDSVASAIRDFMGTQPIWKGLVAELYRELTTSVMSGPRRPADWPGNARWFSDRLRRAAPILRALGIDCRERRVASGAEVTLVRIAPTAELATLATPGPGAEQSGMIRDGANGASVPMKPLNEYFD